jgi:[protein-PII] uridylyltransferase
LSRVGRVFFETGVDLQSAKIATFGSRAEDVFFVTDLQGRPLGEAQQEALREALIKALE